MIEIGYNDYGDVFLRVIDVGGVVWESHETYASLDEAFKEMNTAIETWCTENGIEFKLSEEVASQICGLMAYYRNGNVGCKVFQHGKTSISRN